MAALFNGTAGMAHKPFSRVTAYPFTMFCRAYAEDVTARHLPFALSPNPGAADQSMSLGLRGDESGDRAKFRKANTTTDIPESVTPYSSFTWYNLGGSAGTATSARVYLDGVRTNGAGTSIAFPTASSPVITLGHLIFNGSRLGMNGGGSDFALWDAELTDAEHVSLAKGFSPRRIRPQSLVFYAPMVRNLHDVINGGAWTYPSSAPVVTTHRRVYGF